MSGMATVTIELPTQAAQTGFNLRRWAELVADPELARVEGRIETDRHGHVIMSPPPAPGHGGLQAEIVFLLRQFLSHGRVLTECPISTSDGVKAADVAWASAECLEKLGDRLCFPLAPEICIEVLSPGNTKGEIEEKKLLYFDAGAREVWICSKSGSMKFFLSENGEASEKSGICAAFPSQVELR
jgi:Uma2 family endonuclease